MRVIGFLVVLATGGVLVDATLVGAFGDLEGALLFAVLLAQTMGYVKAAGWMIDFV